MAPTIIAVMRAVRSSPWAPLPLFAAVLSVAGCGAEESVAAPSSAPARIAEPRAAEARPAAEREPVEQLPQSNHAAARRAARALEFGAAAAAAAALADLPAAASFDRRLLTARLDDLRGDPVGAVRGLESLRAEYPNQGRVFATAAELHAAAGRLESAEDEIRRGLAACGPTAELTRARGMLALSRPGAADVGLGHLLAARAARPELWFCDLALSQAQVLLGNAAMADQRPLDALGHARAARVAVPDSVDARELEADASAALGDFTGAIQGYQQLLEDGHDVAGTLALLCQRGATAALLVPDRELALERYLQARQLGLPRADLGFGASMLEAEAERMLEEGIAFWRDGEIVTARLRFERAHACDPDSLEIENHLAVSLRRLGETREAARHWSHVVESARATGVELPEPVHVHLAHALVDDERADEARRVLEAYLAEDEQGRWVDATWEALAELDG